MRRGDFSCPSPKLLCLVKIKSAFEMSDIRGGRVTCYMDDIRPWRSCLGRIVISPETGLDEGQNQLTILSPTENVIRRERL
jgi:hypothetical protein